MRFKLILLTSLIGTLIGAGASIGILIGTLGSWNYVFAPLGSRADSWIGLLLFVPPLVTALLAAIFVYRHTATRRKLQGSVTAILVVVLCLATFVLLTLLSS